MKSHIFLFLSHLIGNNSDWVPVLTVRIGMCLNLILAVVCLGYITSFLLMIVPILPSSVAVGVSILMLASALPFEQLNIDTQNKKDSSLLSFDGYKYPKWTQFCMLLISAMGAMQYLIRNYSLVFNFSKSSAGASFLRGLSKIGYSITAVKFAIWGGISAFAFHFLLAYSNWDKYTQFQHRDELILSQARLVWVLLGAVLLLQMSLSISSFIMIGLICWVFQSVKYPQKLKDASKVIQTFWMQNTHIFLPLGAFLYGLVDFCNSYAIVTQLGWLNTFTITLCASFGVLSFVNISSIWAYNMVREIYRGPHKQVDSGKMFVKLFYCDPSIRRLSIYLREGMLCGLDIMSNKILLDVVSKAMFTIFGVSVGLTVLNLCTVCFALNKVVIMMFQSRADEKNYLTSDNYKYTPAARFAQGVTKFIEEDIPKQLFGVDITQGKLRSNGN